MVREHDVMAPKIVLFSLVAAAGALAGALLVAILGQGLGGLIGGCGWIGISSPLDRQVWALMNQPTLNFSTLLRSLGYWAGSPHECRRWVRSGPHPTNSPTDD